MVFIRLQKESSSSTGWLQVSIATVLVNYTWRENISVLFTIISIRCFIPGRTGVEMPHFQGAGLDSSSTENFCLDVYSYKDPADGENTWSRHGALSVFNHVSCCHLFGQRRCISNLTQGVNLAMLNPLE